MSTALNVSVYTEYTLSVQAGWKWNRIPSVAREAGLCNYEDSFNFLALNDIRLKGMGIGIKTIVFDYLFTKHPFTGSLEKLKNNFYKKLPHISLNSETAKREVIVAPVLLELLDFIEIDIDIEYPLNVNSQLQGNIDYFIRAAGSLVVIEAKKADLEKGFSQLSVEMIAVDQYIEENDIPIYGAVTVGDLWKFGVLNRKEKLVSKDIDSYRVPADLEELFSVFIAILRP